MCYSRRAREEKRRQNFVIHISPLKEMIIFTFGHFCKDALDNVHRSVEGSRTVPDT
jgi:hypothetical protein